MRYEVLTAAMLISWVVTLCVLVDRYQHSEGNAASIFRVKVRSLSSQ
jgi:hypothetical protein